MSALCGDGDQHSGFIITENFLTRWKRHTTVHWDLMPCGVAESYHRFKGTCSLHPLNIRVNSSTLKTLVPIYQTTWYHIPPGCILHVHLCEKFKYCIYEYISIALKDCILLGHILGLNITNRSCSDLHPDNNKNILTNKETLSYFTLSTWKLKPLQAMGQYDQLSILTLSATAKGSGWMLITHINV